MVSGGPCASGLFLRAEGVGGWVYFCSFRNSFAKDLNLDVPEGGVESDGHDVGGTLRACVVVVVVAGVADGVQMEGLDFGKAGEAWPLVLGALVPCQAPVTF